jgi:hypothetical protein
MTLGWPQWIMAERTPSSTQTLGTCASADAFSDISDFHLALELSLTAASVSFEEHMSVRSAYSVDMARLLRLECTGPFSSGTTNMLVQTGAYWGLLSFGLCERTLRDGRVSGWPG